MARGLGISGTDLSLALVKENAAQALAGLKFYPWRPLADIDIPRDFGEDNELQCAGVYVIASFARKSSVVKTMSPNVVYVGETTQRSLKERLKQFWRSAGGDGKGYRFGHCGGRKVFAEFTGVPYADLEKSCPDKAGENGEGCAAAACRKLYVSVVPWTEWKNLKERKNETRNDISYLTAEIKLVERILIWSYILANDRLPRYNGE